MTPEERFAAEISDRLRQRGVNVPRDDLQTFAAKVFLQEGYPPDADDWVEPFLTHLGQRKLARPGMSRWTKATIGASVGAASAFALALLCFVFCQVMAGPAGRLNADLGWALAEGSLAVAPVLGAAAGIAIALRRRPVG